MEPWKQSLTFYDQYIWIIWIYTIQTSKKLVEQLTLLYPTSFQHPEWDQNPVPNDTMSRPAVFIGSPVFPAPPGMYKTL